MKLLRTLKKWHLKSQIVIGLFTIILLVSMVLPLIRPGHAQASPIRMPSFSDNGISYTNACNASYATMTPDELFASDTNFKYWALYDINQDSKIINGDSSYYAAWLLDKNGGNVGPQPSVQDAIGALKSKGFGTMPYLMINGCGFDLVAFPPKDFGPGFDATHDWPVYAVKDQFTASYLYQLKQFDRVGSISIDNTGRIKDVKLPLFTNDYNNQDVLPDGVNNLTLFISTHKGGGGSDGGTPGSLTQNGVTEVSSYDISFFDAAQINFSMAGTVKLDNTPYSFNTGPLKLYDISYDDGKHNYVSNVPDSSCKISLTIDIGSHTSERALVDSPDSSYRVSNYSTIQQKVVDTPALKAQIDFAHLTNGPTSPSNPCVDLVDTGGSAGVIDQLPPPKGTASRWSGYSVNNPLYQGARRSQYTAYYQDESNIIELQGNTLKKIADTPIAGVTALLFSTSGETCNVSDVWAVSAQPYILNRYKKQDGTSCALYSLATDSPKTQFVLSTAEFAKDGTTTTTPNPNPTDTTIPDTKIDKTCESANNSGFEYIGCRALVAMDSALKSIQEATISLLDFDTAKYLTNDVKESWGIIRNIANILLLVIGLIVIIATALGITVLDAYTLRKVLPRLVIAVIGIQLSWYVMVLLVEVFNVLGRGVGAIMLSPFNNGFVDFTSVIAEASASSGGWLFTAASTGALFVGAVSLGFLGLLSLAFTTFLSVLVGFVFLVLRNLVLLIAIIFAPIAILGWILPGTNKLWNVWQNSFTGILLLFPLISIVFAGGKILAWVAAGDTFKAGSGVPFANGDIMQFFVVIIAFAAPYFAIPFLIRFAGGALSAIGGSINNRSKGVFDRSKKYRQGQTAKNTAALKSGSRFQERGFNVGDRRFSAAGRFNRITQGLGTGTKGGFGLGTRGRAAMDISTRAAAAEAMKDPKMNQLQFDDNGVLAMGLAAGSAAQSKTALRKLRAEGGLTNERGETWTDADIDKAVATASSVGITRANSSAALDMMARNKSFALRGNSAASMAAVVGAADRLAGVTRDDSGKVISGNQAMSDNIMGSFEFNSRQAGRMDLGMHNYGTGKADLAGAWSKASLGQHAQAAGPSTASFASHFGRMLHSDNVDERRQAAVAFMEMQHMLPNATNANQIVINNAMRDAGVDFNSPGTVDAQLAALSGGVITAAEIRGTARVYDQTVPAGAREGEPPPAATTGGTSG